MNFIAIPDVLSATEVAVIRESAASLEFVDGRATAGGDAAARKANAQAAPSPARDAVLKKVQQTLTAHPVFIAAARPRHMTPLILSRYREGQTYGSHVDNAIMGGLRTDISFTVFLSEPDSYDGGALEVEDTAGSQPVRLGAGTVVVYPSTTLHRVTPVTRGERLAVVGWAESWVRDAATREILFDLDQVHASLPVGAARDRVAKSVSNLMRRWAGR